MKQTIAWMLLACCTAAGWAQESQPAAQKIAAATTPAITRADLEQRLEELKRAHAQALADVQALGGAIQDCEYWLRRMTPPPAAAKEKPPEKNTKGK